MSEIIIRISKDWSQNLSLCKYYCLYFYISPLHYVSVSTQMQRQNAMWLSWSL